MQLKKLVCGFLQEAFQSEGEWVVSLLVTKQDSFI